MKYALKTGLGIISVLMMFFGFYLALNNFGKDTTSFIIYTVMFGVGLLGLCGSAIWIIIENRNKNN